MDIKVEIWHVCHAETLDEKNKYEPLSFKIQHWQDDLM